MQKKLTIISILFISIFFSISFTTKANNNTNKKLLDKTIAIFKNTVITLSEINRINATLAARKRISSIIYYKNKYSIKDLTELQINVLLIRNKLKAIGYIVDDKRVEAQVKFTEKQLHVDRAALIDFLKSTNITFREYFELIRQSLEYNLFLDKTIKPLISISEQEIKEQFKKLNKQSSVKSFSYDLVDFSINKNKIKKKKIKNLKKLLTVFRETGDLPPFLKNIESNMLKGIEESSLTSKLKNAIKKININEFTSPVILNNKIHLFFLTKKNVINSSQYIESKSKIKNQLIVSKTNILAKSWLKKDRINYFIKTFYTN